MLQLLGFNSRFFPARGVDKGREKEDRRPLPYAAGRQSEDVYPSHAFRLKKKRPAHFRLGNGSLFTLL